MLYQSSFHIQSAAGRQFSGNSQVLLSGALFLQVIIPETHSLAFGNNNPIPRAPNGKAQPSFPDLGGGRSQTESPQLWVAVVLSVPGQVHQAQMTT
jgi:hypothetical protein